MRLQVQGLKQQQCYILFVGLCVFRFKIATGLKQQPFGLGSYNILLYGQRCVRLVLVFICVNLFSKGAYSLGIFRFEIIFQLMGLYTKVFICHTYQLYWYWSYLFGLDRKVLAVCYLKGAKMCQVGQGAIASGLVQVANWSRSFQICDYRSKV